MKNSIHSHQKLTWNDIWISHGWTVWERTTLLFFKRWWDPATIHCLRGIHAGTLQQSIFKKLLKIRRDKCSKRLSSPHSIETGCKRGHHAVFSCFLSSLIKSNCTFVCQRTFTNPKSKSSRLRNTRSSMEKLVKTSFVSSSVSWFSSRGLHLKSSDSLDFAKHDGNSLFFPRNVADIAQRLGPVQENINTT